MAVNHNSQLSAYTWYIYECDK